jgi:hypothetical protein
LRRVAITMARSNGKAFFTNFGTYDAPFPTRARLALANSWKKGTHPIRLLWELRSARLLTASRGAREGPHDHGHPPHHDNEDG